MIRKLLITLAILLTTLPAFAGDMTRYTTSIPGGCATVTILEMLSTQGIYHDLYTYHTQVLQQPTHYDFSQYKTWEQLDAIVPEIVTVYTTDLSVIDSELSAGRPVGVYFMLWGYGHTMTVYGGDAWGYTVHEATNTVFAVSRDDMQNILDQYMRVWVLV